MPDYVQLPDGRVVPAQTSQRSEETYLPPHDEDIRWMFDYGINLANIRLHLEGKTIITGEKGKEKAIKVADPLLNPYGINQTMALLFGFVDGRVQGLTAYSEGRILKICMDLHERLTIFYFVNMDAFELLPEKASVVINLIMNLFESNIRKSLNAQSMKLLGQSEKIITTQDSKKRGFLRKLI